MSVEAVVGLGANVGDRLEALQGAVVALDAHPEVEVVGTSAVYETEALVPPGEPPQADHLNAAVALSTSLGPFALLRLLHRIERDVGRDPGAQRWAPRPLDLDLLLYGDATIAMDGLVVPHQALANRRFVLTPLADLGADRGVPGLGATVGGLLAACADRLAVRRTDRSLR